MSSRRRRWMRHRDIDIPADERIDDPEEQPGLQQEDEAAGDDEDRQRLHDESLDGSQVAPDPARDDQLDEVRQPLRRAARTKAVAGAAVPGRVASSGRQRPRFATRRKLRATEKPLTARTVGTANRRRATAPTRSIRPRALGQ